MCRRSLAAQPRVFAAAWDGGRQVMCGSSKLFLVQSAFVGATEDEVVTLATVLSPWSGLVLHATVDAVVLYDANSGRQLKRLDQLMAGGGADVTACAADPCIRKVRCAVFFSLSLCLLLRARLSSGRHDATVHP